MYKTIFSSQASPPAGHFALLLNLFLCGLTAKCILFLGNVFFKCTLAFTPLGVHRGSQSKTSFQPPLNKYIAFLYWLSLLGLTYSPAFLMERRLLCLQPKFRLHSNIPMLLFFLVCLSDY